MVFELEIFRQSLHRATEKRRIPENTTQIVTPAVVRAANHLATVSITIDQLQIAMPTDIMKRRDIALLIPQQEKRQPGNLDWFHITGSRQLMRVTDKHPVMVEQMLMLKLHERIADISLTRQAMSQHPVLVEAVKQ
jgi:hypothetical protein